ncbi:MAG: hypothetical protein ACYDEI_06525 [Erysipelotrichaceae bacterium]
MFKKSTIFKFVLVGIVIFILAVIVNYLPKNPVHKKPPTDYFRVIYHLPYIESDKYTIISYEEELFEYFSILKFNNQSDIAQFVSELKQDELTIEYEVVNGVAPALNLIEESNINELSKVELLPFDLKCGCFRYFTYNLEMKNRGYLYLILIYEDLIIIDYMTR